MAKVIIRLEQPGLSERLRPFQFGVNVPGGPEAVIHAVRALYQSHSDWCTLQVDISNAYGTMSRLSIADALSNLPKETCQYTMRYFQQVYLGQRVMIVTRGKTKCSAVTGVILSVFFK